MSEFSCETPCGDSEDKLGLTNDNSVFDPSWCTLSKNAANEKISIFNRVWDRYSAN